MPVLQFRTRPRGGTGDRRPIVSYSWRGRQIVDSIDERISDVLRNVAEMAEDYWITVVWGYPLPNEMHPYATGKEASHGHFVPTASGQPHRFGLIGYVDLDEEYPIYVEFGTATQEGQMVLRRTMDWIVPQIAPLIRQAVRAQLATPSN